LRRIAMNPRRKTAVYLTRFTFKIQDSRFKIQDSRFKIDQEKAERVRIT